MTTRTVDVALAVARAFEQLGIEYLVGGSLASSLAGEPRSTLDIDFVVSIAEEQVPELFDALGADFYGDPASIAGAVRRNASANIFHAPSAVKVDLFMLGPSAFEREQMGRRRRVQVARDPDRFLFTYTPEDIALQKLRWYRMGGHASDRQWRDVLSVLRVSGPALDVEHLRRGAEAFEVVDLLARALAEAESG